MRICFTGRPGPSDELLIQQLAEAGFRVEVVGSRAPRDADLPPGVAGRQADLSVPGDWQSALDGCDLVVHRPDPDGPVVGTPAAAAAIDAVFQVVWGIEQVEHPPALLLVLLPPARCSTNCGLQALRVFKNYRPPWFFGRELNAYVRASKLNSS